MVDQKKERAKYILNWYESRVDQKLEPWVSEQFVRLSIYRDGVLWLHMLIFDEVIDLAVFETSFEPVGFDSRTYSFEETRKCIDFLDSLLVLKDMNID